MRGHILALASVALIACGSGSGSPPPCSGASCTATCTPGAPCTPAQADPCKTYATTCTGSQSSCVAAGNASDGASCGGGQVCKAGACIAACVPNVDCTPASPAACTVYRTTCNAIATETTCASTRADDGTACGGGQVCEAGACVAAIRTVSSTLQTVYVAEDGTETTASGWPTFETSNARLTALLVPDNSASGYAVYPVTVAGDSTFSVANVPAGRYFIQVDVDSSVSQTVSLPQGGTTSEIVVVTDRMLYEAWDDHPDLSIRVARRPDATPVTQSTPVTLRVQGLAPWSSTSALRIFSAQLPLNVLVNSSNLSPRPADGDTSLDSTTDWLPWSWLPRPTDSLWIWQRARTPIGSGAGATTLASALAAAKVTGASIADGSGGTISANLAAAPQTGTFPADLRLSEFAALAPAAHPGAVPSDDPSFAPAIAVGAVPHDLSYPNEPQSNLPGVAVIDLSLPAIVQIETFSATAFLSVPTPLTDVNYGSPTYGQVFDGPWREAVQFIYFFDVPFGGTMIKGGASYRSFVAKGNGEPAPVRPAIAPPTAPTINGADAFTTASGVSTQPTFAWSPPSIGTATRYVVTVRAQAAFQTGDVAAVSAVVHDLRSFRVPAGFMKSGGLYVGSIKAVNAPGGRGDPVLRIGAPAYEADCLFGEFSP